MNTEQIQQRIANLEPVLAALRFRLELRKKALSDGTLWHETDASTNQKYLILVPGMLYLFREDRVVNPVTFERETFEKIMCIHDYRLAEMIEACEVFGYSAAEVMSWFMQQTNAELILECIFELES